MKLKLIVLIKKRIKKMEGNVWGQIEGAKDMDSQEAEKNSSLS